MRIFDEVTLEYYQRGWSWQDVRNDAVRCMGPSCTRLILSCKISWNKVKKMEANGNKVYYCNMYQKEFGIRRSYGFDTMAIRDRVLKIRKAANMNTDIVDNKNHHRVRIRYLKGGKKIVLRDVAFYSFKDGLLYGTDTKHGNKKIRSYRCDRIKSAKVLDTKFKPEWRIEL